MILAMVLASVLAVDTKTFLKAVQSRDIPAIQTMLAEDPTLVNAHTTRGSSVVTLAMFSIPKGEESFQNPPDNEVLQAILAHHPKLDNFDVAALGTPQQLGAILKSDPAALMRLSPAGWTLLHTAAFAGNVPNTELLIAKGADVNKRAQSKFLNTPLMAALLSNQAATTKILLEHGADVLVRDASGFTPMHEAAVAGRQDLVQLLLDHGAQLNSVADNGKTPLAEAMRMKYEPLIVWLKAKGAVEAAIPDNE